MPGWQQVNVNCDGNVLPHMTTSSPGPRHMSHESKNCPLVALLCCPLPRIAAHCPGCQCPVSTLYTGHGHPGSRGHGAAPQQSKAMPASKNLVVSNPLLLDNLSLQIDCFKSLLEGRLCDYKPKLL